MTFGFMIHNNGEVSEVEEHTDKMWALMQCDCYGKKVSAVVKFNNEEDAVMTREEIREVMSNDEW